MNEARSSDLLHGECLLSFSFGLPVNKGTNCDERPSPSGTIHLGHQIPAKPVLICTRDQVQKGSVSQDNVTITPDTLTGITHWDITNFCSQKILSFIMHIPSHRNTTTTDVPWQPSSLSISPDVMLSNEKQAFGEKFAWKLITWKYVSIPEKHSGSVSQLPELPEGLKKRL